MAQTVPAGKAEISQRLKGNIFKAAEKLISSVAWSPALLLLD